MNRFGMTRAAIALLIVAGNAGYGFEVRPLAGIKVNAGGHARTDTPVSAVLPGGISPWQPLRLVETTGGGADRPVAHQTDPVEPDRIWWILNGETAAGAERTFRLDHAFPVYREGVRANINPRTLALEHGGRTVFEYNHAHVIPPEGIQEDYIRSGYIHPMFSPSGLLITEDFPSDHLHHKGIWFPWTHTEFDGHEVDFWNLGKKLGTVRFAGFENVVSGPVFGGFVSNHEHVDLTQGEGKIALNEVWDVRLYSVGGADAGYWLWDLTSKQTLASESPLKLLEYRYGGLGFRGAKEWNGRAYKVLTSEGKTKINGHTTRARWCDHTGEIDGKWSGVTLMDHPSNFRHPQSMRIWPANGAFFNWAPVQLGDHTIEPGDEYVSRYRFFVHEGEATVERMEAAWTDFGDPPAVTITAVK